MDALWYKFLCQCKCVGQFQSLAPTEIMFNCNVQRIHVGEAISKLWWHQHKLNKNNPSFQKQNKKEGVKTTDVSQPIAKTKATDQQAGQGAMLCPYRPADATYRLGSRALLHLGCGSYISYNLLRRRSSGLIQKIHFIFSFSVWHFWREYRLFRESIFDFFFFLKKVPMCFCIYTTNSGLHLFGLFFY